MNAPDQNAERIWRNTLEEVRATRTRRKRRGIAMGVAVCSIAGAWLTLSTHPSPARPFPRLATTEAPAPAAAMLVVMRISENGGVRLEELPPAELGSIELAFGLTPTLVDGHEEW